MLEIMRYELVSAHPDSVEHLQRARTSCGAAWCAACPSAISLSGGGEVKVFQDYIRVW